MPPLGKCPRSIAPAATMVDDFEKKKNTTKTQLLPSFLMVDQCKKAIDFQNSPGTLYSRPLGAQSHNPNPYATSQAEMFSYILTY